jgi:hypothetical protein
LNFYALRHTFEKLTRRNLPHGARRIESIVKRSRTSRRDALWSRNGFLAVVVAPLWRAAK